MSTKTKQYAHQCIAASGFAVMNSNFAWQLRPDLWASAQDCGVGFNRNVTVEGAQRLTAKLHGGGNVLVLTKSTDMLEKRIEWVTGQKVLELCPEVQPIVTFSSPVTTEFKRLAEEKLADLQSLAEQDLPAHDCSLRRDILAARRELGQMAA